MLFLVLGGLLSNGAALGQYIYIDTDGDGVSTAVDRLRMGGPTLLDIWLRTDQNRDGSKATPIGEPAKELSMFSYELALRATKGKVQWGEYVNQMPTMNFEFRTDRTAEYFYTGYAGETALSPGRYKLGTLSVTVQSGNPRIEFVATGPLFPPIETSIGSVCKGRDGDHTLKFTEDATGAGPARIGSSGDWSGADGVTSALRLGEAPPEYAGTVSRPDGVAPNPFNPRGLITFSLRSGGLVRVTVFDTNGRLVRVLVPRQALAAGSHTIPFDGRDRNGKRIGSGVYFYRVERTEGAITGRFVILK